MGIHRAHSRTPSAVGAMDDVAQLLLEQDSNCTEDNSKFPVSVVPRYNDSIAH